MHGRAQELLHCEDTRRAAAGALRAEPHRLGALLAPLGHYACFASAGRTLAALAQDPLLAAAFVAGGALPKARTVFLTAVIDSHNKLQHNVHCLCWCLLGNLVVYCPVYGGHHMLEQLQHLVWVHARRCCRCWSTCR